MTELLTELLKEPAAHFAEKKKGGMKELGTNILPFVQPDLWLQNLIITKLEAIFIYWPLPLL